MTADDKVPSETDPVSKQRLMEEPPAKRTLEAIELAAPVTSADRGRIYESFFFEGHRRRPYLSRFVVLMILSSLIAGLGLVNDSAAVVIGAMLIAPLMTPLLASSAAIVEGWPRRVGESLLTILLGAGLGIGVGIIIALLIPRIQSEVLLPGEILGRTEPNIVDLAIALAAGAAGAYVMVRSEAASALPGVGIAVALVPPLATVGITFGIGETELASGALLLFATNWLAIVLAAGIVFALVGFGAHRGVRGRFEGGLAAVGLIALLIVLVIPLGLNAVERWGDSAKNREASEVVREWDATLAVENLVVDTTVDPTQVRLQVSGRSAPDSTDELAQLLADRLEEPVFLRIRFRPEFSAGSVALDE